MDDCGIGASARVGMEVFEQASRGSGRTRRMIMGLPSGVHVFIRGQNADWFRGMIRGLRGADFEFSVSAYSELRHSRQAIITALHRREPVAIDHYLVSLFYEAALDRARDELREFGVVSHRFSEATSNRAVPQVASFREPI